jgi:hypothetical protein
MTRFQFRGAIAAVALLAAGPAMSAAKNPMVGGAAMYPTDHAGRRSEGRRPR